MAEITAAPARVDTIQDAYMAQTKRKRLYSFITLVIFIFAKDIGSFQLVSQ